MSNIELSVFNNDYTEHYNDAVITMLKFITNHYILSRLDIGFWI